jgi:hypothetical protein
MGKLHDRRNQIRQTYSLRGYFAQRHAAVWKNSESNIQIKRTINDNLDAYDEEDHSHLTESQAVHLTE